MYDDNIENFITQIDKDRKNDNTINNINSDAYGATRKLYQQAIKQIVEELPLLRPLLPLRCPLLTTLITLRHLSHT